jgi:transcription elongation factor Elf1
VTTKTNFECGACGCEGTVTIKTDDEHALEVCPACGQCLDMDDDQEGWDD